MDDESVAALHRDAARDYAAAAPQRDTGNDADTRARAAEAAGSAS
ncbi:hypothetical protein [Streptomyces cacaoi]|nr:hypothetical protein [Streptomyces cacaoi]